MGMRKSMVTNVVAGGCVAFAFVLSDPWSHLLLMTGLFALSGALTNTLAIHMLFERVPLLYGSGVIEARFEVFKASVRDLMMQQFFTKAQLDAFFAAEEQQIDITPMMETMDVSPAYDALTKTVMESSFGGMLGMFGGEKALESLREPFSAKLKTALIDIVSTETFKTQLQASLQASSLSDDMMASIEGLIEARLKVLTPQLVKEMVQRLIGEHLGWLVVWGGVFGGVIGLLSAMIL